MSTADTSAHLDDRAQLHRLGYAQELFRSMGGFQNFAISFTIISILAGCLTSYSIAFNQGGPVAITWGWLIVGLVLHLRLAGDGRDRLDLPDGRRALLLVVEARQPRLGLVHGLVQPDRPDRGHRRDRLRLRDLHDLAAEPAHSGLPRTRTTGSTSLYGIIMLGAGLINLFKVSITAVLNAFSAWWHMVGVRRDRVHPGDRPRSPPVVQLRLRADDQQHRASAATTGRTASSSTCS